MYIVDRIKDLVISGGENIHPAEVENVLFGHPAVAEAAVIGLSDTRWGEAVTAVIALRPGKHVTLEELREFAAQSLARYRTAPAVTHRRRTPAQLHREGPQIPSFSRGTQELEAAAARGCQGPAIQSAARLDQCAGLAWRKARGVGRRAGSALGGGSGGRSAAEVADAVPVGAEVAAVADPACVLDGVADGEEPVPDGSARGTTPTAWPMLVPEVVEPETGWPMISSTAVIAARATATPTATAVARRSQPRPPGWPLQRRRRQQLGPGISLVRTRDQPPVRTAGGHRRLGLPHRPHGAQLHRRPVQGLRIDRRANRRHHRPDDGADERALHAQERPGQSRSPGGQ